MSNNLSITVDDCNTLLKNFFGVSKPYLSHKLIRICEGTLGFLGDHRQLIIQINDDSNSDSAKTINFFVKSMPAVKAHSDYINSIGAFKKEVLLYDKLMPDLQRIASFLKNPWCPKCYLIKDNTLVFENLIDKDYRMADEELLDLEHCIMVAKTLADFHASSIVLENRENIRIDEKFPDIVKEATYVFEEEHMRSKWLTSGINALIHLCTLIQRENDASIVSNKIRAAVSDIKPSSGSCNALCHGDLWTNNFMFSYVNGKVDHCILVDFQLVRYAPCALDLMCCLHLVAKKLVRDQNMSLLIDVYFERLSSSLRRCGIDADKILTRSRFIEDCNKYKLTGLAETCLYGLNIWLPNSLTKEVLSSPTRCQDIVLGDRSPLIEKAFYDDEFFRTQISSVLNEFLDF